MLLQAAGEKGPFVLVGASIGGIYIRAYQRTFPGDVAALVFTNSAGRVGLITKSGGDLLWKLSEDDIRSAYPLPATARLPRPARIGQPFDRLPGDLPAIRLWLDIRLWESLDPTTMSPASILSWRREFLREFEETDANRQPLGSLPVVVISSGPIASETERASRDNAGVRLDFLSSNSLHIEATGSGHEIHLFQPARVIEGIARALVAVRTRARSPADKSTLRHRAQDIEPRQGFGGLMRGPLKSPSTTCTTRCVTSPFSSATNSMMPPRNENIVVDCGTIRPLPLPGTSIIN